jgi:DNA-binding CsgD family transcriptional regulator
MSRHQQVAISSSQSLRRTGIDLIGDQPWGTHICLFYETPQDLLEVHGDYFSVGLADGEFCIWALTDPISRDEAIESFHKTIPNFDHHLRDGHIELVSGYRWYLRGAEFDPQQIIGAWRNKLDEALERGFSGMRVSGNAFWFETSMWAAFREYEAEINLAFNARRMLALCTYSIPESRAVDLLDVVSTHNFSVAIRNGQWEFLETTERAEDDREIRYLNSPVENLFNSFPGRRSLSDRERLVLAQLVKGASSKEAARALQISPRTVEYHRGNIMRKLGARNIADLLRIIFGP